MLGEKHIEDIICIENSIGSGPITRTASAVLYLVEHGLQLASENGDM